MSHRWKWLGLVFASLVGVAHADPWDDFANNLFTDLAPLLALFGERATMQFLSQALGWEDCVVIAIAPLGIITILVSAIRVGGPAWLKSIIGRARENVSAAEMELMSSTSKEVCELYNGQTIVRCQGSSPVWEFIYLIPVGPLSRELAIQTMTLEEACKEDKKLLYKLNDGNPTGKSEARLDPRLPGENKLARIFHTAFGNPPSPTSSDVSVEQGIGPDPDQSRNEAIHVIRNVGSGAPNMILNLQNNDSNRKELRACAMIGVTLQLCVLVFFGIITYHPAVKDIFRKDDRPIDDYAFPLAVSGTLILILGVFCCGTVVESSTQETHYRKNDKYEMRVVWIQQKQTVGDQVFEPFATFPGSPKEVITMSHRCDTFQALGPLTVIGISIGLAGFIIQFIGLRGMNSAATLAQLSAVGIMAAIRAWVRRGLARPPQQEKLTSGFELDTLAWALSLSNQSWNRKSEPAVSESPEERLGTSSNVRQGDQRAQQNSQKFPQLGQLMNLERQQKYSWAIYTGDAVDHQPFFDASSEDAPSPNFGAQQVLEARRNLCRLAQWKGVSAAEAINLATAMEKVMDVLFPLSSTDADRLWMWPLAISYGNSGPTRATQCHVHLSVTGRNGSWKVSADQLESILSLFLFTVQKQEDSKSRGGQGESDLDDENNDWLRQKTINSGLGIRLFGSKDSRESERLIQDLAWWAPETFNTLAELQEVESLDVKSETQKGRCRHGLEVSKRNLRREFEIAFRPDPRLDAVRVDYDRVVGYGPPCPRSPRHSQKRRYFCNFSTFCHCKSSGNGRGTVAVVSSDSLERLYAKDLLFSFLFSAAKTLPIPLQSEVSTRGTAIKSSFNHASTALVTKEMTSLADEFRRLGYGTEQEAWVSVVAPLSMTERLPFPQLLFDRTRERAEDFRREHKWRDATVEYLNLWEQTERHSSGSRGIFGMSTAAVMEHLCELKEELDVDFFGDLGLKLSMKESVREICSTLRKSELDAAFYDPLARLYQEQRRPAMLRALEEVSSSQPADDLPDYFGVTKLHQMAMESDDRAIRVGKGIVWGDVNERDICDWTPLHYATVQGSHAIVTNLLAQGADPNLKDLVGYTPVHYTCQHGNWNILKTLESRGGRLDARGAGGTTPMHLAAKNGHVELIRSWNHEANRNVAGGWNGGSEWRYWLEPPFRLRDHNGHMPVHLAVIHGQRHVVLELKSTAHEPDAYGWTSLHLATLYHQEDSELLQTVLQTPVEMEKRDRQGCTALILALYRNRGKAARLLIEAGADVAATAPDGTAALYYPLEHSDTDAIQALVGKGAEVNKPMHKLDGWIPLHLMARRGNLKIMTTLLGALDRLERENWPKVVDCSIESGQTPLHVATCYKQLDMMRLLLSKGADSNRANNRQQAPLHCALVLEDGKKAPKVRKTEQGIRLEMVKLLLDNNADIWARDSQGRTPFEVAETNGFAEAATHLRNCEFLWRAGMPIPTMTVKEGLIRARASRQKKG